MYNQKFRVYQFTEECAILEFEEISEKVLERVLSVRDKLEKMGLGIFTDLVTGYNTLAVFYNFYDLKKQSNTNVANYVKSLLISLANESVASTFGTGNIYRIPVCYDEEFGPDLKYVSDLKSLSVQEIIKIHSEKSYLVYLVGFLPGFPYLGFVDEKISVPRKIRPEPLIRSGSIGIAGNQTGVYPLDSPGGWQIIGRTPVQLFSKEKYPPVMVQPGDKVIFYSISRNEFNQWPSGS